MSLAIIETHPIQYHAPVWRAVQQTHGIPVTAIYGSDFSVAGYRDAEFGATFKWDTDLLSGYNPVFLSQVAKGGAKSAAAVQSDGLTEALRQAAPKAVMVVGYSPRFHRDAFRAARQTRQPVLFRGETTDHARARSLLKAWARETILKKMYRRCTKLLYVGKLSLQHFKRLHCPDNKLIFSPYCVDTAAFQTDEAARQQWRGLTREKLGIASDRKVLLFSGKLSPRKGPDLLLQAIKQLPETSRERLVLLFLGDGELRESLKATAQQSPAITAHFLGFQNQSCLSQYYHAADLLVLPSVLSETWGLVVNEALLHGLPAVVSTGVGSAPDLIVPGVTGEVFASGSVVELSAALTRALALPEGADRRAKCREKVAGYSVAAAAAGIARAFQEATGT